MEDCLGAIHHFFRQPRKEEEEEEWEDIAGGGLLFHHIAISSEMPLVLEFVNTGASIMLREYYGV